MNANLIKKIHRFLISKNIWTPFTKEEFLFFQFKKDKKQINWKTVYIQNVYKKNLISIILPVYNGEKYLEKTLKSIINQTYKNWECICINDGSTDSTPLILNTFSQLDDRIQVINQKNLKLPNALNKGFENAKGEYFTWISADNEYEKDFLEIFFNEFKNNKDVDLFFGNFGLIDENDKNLENSQYFKTYQNPRGSSKIVLPNRVLELNTRSNNTIGPAFMYHSRVKMILGGYSNHWYTVEDYDYWMRINENLKIQHISSPKIIYKYRFHSKSLTAQKDSLKIDSITDQLIIWDNFRRDYYSYPLLIIVESPLQEKLAKYIPENSYVFSQKEFLKMGLNNYSLPVLEFISIHESNYRTIDIDWIYKIYVYHSNDEIQGFGFAEFLINLQNSDNMTKSAIKKTINLSENAPNNFQIIADTVIRAYYLNKLEEISFVENQKELDSSIIICSNRDIKSLETLLTKITSQISIAHSELILVINKYVITEEEYEYLENYQNKKLVTKMIINPIPGLSISRNIGILNSSGSKIIFLDDDSLPEPNWYEEIINGFSIKFAGVVGGNIIFSVDGKCPLWLTPNKYKYWSHRKPNLEKPTIVDSQNNFPWGANWACDKKAILRIGGFRDRFGRKGNRFLGGEEIIASELIRRIGYNIVFSPLSTVKHIITSDRINKKHIFRTIVNGYLSVQIAKDEGYFSTIRKSTIIESERMIMSMDIFISHLIGKIYLYSFIMINYFKRILFSVSYGKKD